MARQMIKNDNRDNRLRIETNTVTKVVSIVSIVV